MSDTITLEVLRYHPETDSAPHFQQIVPSPSNTCVICQQFSQTTPSARDSTLAPQTTHGCGYNSARQES